ncbi:cell division protein ZapA [Afifella sp. IM 167]|uniref:cell division protein ZapA n=1 Tax=Afifella sp. IM 167 TaxID=2033586 RepID=UPI001CC9D582|nr:cell division protein ZapA [Afifella sp. IM 167]MBZ8133073.1 cell division protein ZapA [Afifella sp. IM 167]
MATVTVTIAGHRYRLACDDGQEDHVARLGERLDETVQELRASVGEIGDQRLTVMAAMLTMDRLSEAEERIAALQDEIAELREGRNEALDRCEALEAEVSEAMERTSERLSQIARTVRGTAAS